MALRDLATSAAGPGQGSLGRSDLQQKQSILERWGITADDLTTVVEGNPSLRGMILGYMAEHKLRELLSRDKRLTNFRKDDDHDRERKGDLVVTYRDYDFRLEAKSLQSNTIRIRAAGDSQIPMVRRTKIGTTKSGRPKYTYRRNPDFDRIQSSDRLAGSYTGALQCDASDCRKVELPGGKAVETTCLLVDEFDIIAVGLFAFRDQWDFAFALNRDLPRTKSEKYPARLRKYLLATLVQITWPLKPPFVTDPFALLDRLVAEKRPKKS
jgi:hypothetical protein